ncbi:MAG: ribosome small subunit-dependent GTPase A [Thermoleophilia bacterium]|nr:ribosome small subunit-dependent GTPase A [Thermoleophilia bacterium]
MTLDELGWGPHFEATFAPFRGLGLLPARVATQHRGGFGLLGADGPRAGVPAGTLDALPAVGDWVVAAPVPDEDKAVIEAVLPRRTAFTRSDPWSGAEEVVAANVDTVLVVTVPGRDFSPRRLERYLAAAHESGATPVVLVNKADLDPGSPAVEAARAAAPGVPVHFLSAKTGEGLAQLDPYLARGQTVALLGSSGVGKSTLANRLAGADLATGDVRADERGRHTTSRRQLVVLPRGGLLLDTPGLRELQLSGADLGEAFPEIAELASQCRFRDCSHSHEPGCAVLAAVENGVLPRERHESYLKLAAELAELGERRRRAAW